MKAAQAVHFANVNAYPTTIDDLRNATPPELELSGASEVDAKTLQGTNGKWTLKVSGGGGDTPMDVACT